MHFCRYYHEGDALPRDVRQLLETEAFAGFYGTSHPDGDPRASAGPELIGEPRPTTDTTAATYGPLRNAIRRMVHTAGFQHLTRNNVELSERLAHDAVHWCDNQSVQAASTDAHGAEQQALQSVDETVDDGPAVHQLAAEIIARRPELRMLGETAVALVAVDAGTGDDIATLRRSVTAAAVRGRLVSEWQQRIDRDHAAHLTMTIRRAFAAFMSELEATVPLLARRQSIVRDLFGSEDALWDLSPGEWQSVPWPALEETASMLAEHDELTRLAEVLGRSKVVTQERTEVREEREVRVEAVGIGKSEVTGARFGDDLTSLLPSELALLSDPDTEELFYAKLAHKELLVLDYRREQLVTYTRRRPVMVREQIAIPRGPVIVCVDTSGSMIGLPEKVAKATTLALAQRVGIDRRPIYVIAFSTETQSFELLPGQLALPQLAGFLGSSFRGGTDLRPALNAALERLEENLYRYADVLVISDFRVPKIADRFLDRLTRQQRRGTLIHSLTIADRPVTDPMHIFDHSWLFDISTPRVGIVPNSIRFLN